MEFSREEFKCKKTKMTLPIATEISQIL